MAKKASQSAAERELHLVLNAIAAPAEDQLDVYHGICIPHSLEGRFEYTSGRVLNARKKPPSAGCRAAIEDLAGRFKRVHEDGRHACGEDAYVTGSPIWDEVRQSARRALDAFGWPCEDPRRDTVVKETIVWGEDKVPRSRKRRPSWARAWTGGDTTLKYHRALFEMLDIDPVVSAPFARIVAEREQALGRKLPASIAELFRLRGIFDLFDENAGGETLGPFVYQGDHRARLRALGHPRHVEQGYMIVSVASQGIVTLYAALDGSDDPPVYHDGDQSGTEDDEHDLSEVDWVPVTPSFSGFVFDMMTRYRFESSGHEIQLRAVAPAPTTKQSEALASALRPGPRDERDGLRIERYFTPHGLIRISNDDEHLKAGQANWTVQPDSLDALGHFVLALAGIGFPLRHLELYARPDNLQDRGHGPARTAAP